MFYDTHKACSSFMCAGPGDLLRSFTCNGIDSNAAASVAGATSVRVPAATTTSCQGTISSKMNGVIHASTDFSVIQEDLAVMAVPSVKMYGKLRKRKYANDKFYEALDRHGQLRGESKQPIEMVKPKQKIEISHHLFNGSISTELNERESLLYDNDSMLDEVQSSETVPKRPKRRSTVPQSYSLLLKQGLYVDSTTPMATSVSKFLFLDASISGASKDTPVLARESSREYCCDRETKRGRSYGDKLTLSSPRNFRFRRNSDASCSSCPTVSVELPAESSCSVIDTEVSRSAEYIDGDHAAQCFRGTSALPITSSIGVNYDSVQFSDEQAHSYSGDTSVHPWYTPQPGESLLNWLTRANEIMAKRPCSNTGRTMDAGALAFSPRANSERPTCSTLLISPREKFDIQHGKDTAAVPCPLWLADRYAKFAKCAGLVNCTSHVVREVLQPRISGEDNGCSMTELPTNVSTVSSVLREPIMSLSVLRTACTDIAHLALELPLVNPLYCLFALKTVCFESVWRKELLRDAHVSLPPPARHLSDPRSRTQGLLICKACGCMGREKSLSPVISTIWVCNECQEPYQQFVARPWYYTSAMKCQKGGRCLKQPDRCKACWFWHCVSLVKQIIADEESNSQPKKRVKILKPALGWKRKLDAVGDDIDVEELKALSTISTGPRVKHVCRRQQIATGLPLALVPDKRLSHQSNDHEVANGFHLSALPEDQKHEIYRREQYARDDEVPVYERSLVYAPRGMKLWDMDGCGMFSASEQPDDETVDRMAVAVRPQCSTKKSHRSGVVACGRCVGCMADDCKTCANCQSPLAYNGLKRGKSLCRKRQCRDVVKHRIECDLKTQPSLQLSSCGSCLQCLKPECGWCLRCWDKVYFGGRYYGLSSPCRFKVCIRHAEHHVAVGASEFTGPAEAGKLSPTALDELELNITDSFDDFKPNAKNQLELSCAVAMDKTDSDVASNVRKNNTPQVGAVTAEFLPILESIPLSCPASAVDCNLLDSDEEIQF